MSGRAKQCIGRTAPRLVAPFEELKPVTPRVFGVEPPRARQILAIDHRMVPAQQRFPQRVEIFHCERRMRLPRRAKILLYADMQLMFTALEPAATASAKRLWLLNL